MVQNLSTYMLLSCRAASSQCKASCLQHSSTPSFLSTTERICSPCQWTLCLWLAVQSNF